MSENWIIDGVEVYGLWMTLAVVENSIFTGVVGTELVSCIMWNTDAGGGTMSDEG